MLRDLKRYNSHALFTVLCLLLWSIPAFAQSDTATVLGTVRDSNGAVLAGVTLILKNIETGSTSNVVSDGDGNYSFVNVKNGRYQVAATHDGFSRFVADNISVGVNARQRVDFAMQPGAVSENVVVTDAAELLETDSSDRGQIINRKQIVDLPLNGRSYANLTLLSPGVRESSVNGIGSPGREAAFNVNGLRNTFNNFLLDGVDNNAYGTSNQSFSSQVVQVSPG